MFKPPFIVQKGFTESARLVWRELPPVEGYGSSAKAPDKPAKKTEVLPPEEAAKNKEELDQLQAKVELTKRVNELLKKHEKEILDFIQKHESNYNSGDWVQWNKDFIVALGFESANDTENTNIIKAIQYALKVTVDGKVGPRTIKSLNAYLREFDLSSHDPYKNLNTEAINRERLDKEELADYYLDVLKEEKSLISDQYKDSFGELEDQVKNIFYLKAADFIFEHQDRLTLNTLNDWKNAFMESGLSEEEIEELGIKMDTTQEKISTDIQSHSVTVFPEKSKINLNSPEFKELLQSAVKPFKDETEVLKNSINDEKNNALIDLEEIEDDPYDWNNMIDDLEGPNKALDEYKKAYDKFYKAYNDKVDFGIPLEEKNVKYEELQKAVDSYYIKLNESVDKTQSDYEAKLLAILGKYDFPKGMPLELFTDSSDFLASYNGHPFTRELNTKGVKYFESFIDEYLINGDGESPPLKAIHSEEEFKQYVLGKSNEEKEYILGEIKKFVVTEKGKNFVEAVNSWIYFHNARRFTKEHEDLLRDMRQAREKSMEIARGLSIEQ